MSESKPWYKITCINSPGSHITELRGRRKITTPGLTWIVFDKAKCKLPDGRQDYFSSNPVALFSSTTPDECHKEIARLQGRAT